MRVLILAAGYGTRLYPIIKDKPKAFLEIGERVLIDFVLDRLVPVKGIKELYIVTNDKFANDFKDWATKQKLPWPVEIINDQTKTPEERLGSVGDINFTLNKKGTGDDLLVIGSDNLFDFSIEDYVLFSQEKKAITLGLYDIGNIKEANKYGVVEIDQNRKVVSFEEKPENPKSSLIAMCLYYFPKNSLKLISQYLIESKKSDKAGEYIRWASEKSDVYGYKFKGKWYDIGSIESYQEAQATFI